MSLLQEIVAKKNEWQGRNGRGLMPTITMSKLSYFKLRAELEGKGRCYTCDKYEGDVFAEEIFGMEIKVVDGITI